MKVKEFFPLLNPGQNQLVATRIIRPLNLFFRNNFESDIDRYNGVHLDLLLYSHFLFNMHSIHFPLYWDAAVFALRSISKRVTSVGFSCLFFAQTWCFVQNSWWPADQFLMYAFPEWECYLPMCFSLSHGFKVMVWVIIWVITQIVKYIFFVIFFVY